MASKTKIRTLDWLADSSAIGDAEVTAPVRRQHFGGVLTVSMVWAFAAILPGCGADEKEIKAFVHEWEASVSASDYHVQPPDSLEVNSANAPEIDGEIQTIRQDGKITLRLLGEVKVAGLTPVEIARKLESLLRKYYIEPQVSVRVSSAGSKRYYVFGQVAREGPFPYTGRDTLIGALAQAGPKFTAAKEMIKVIRPSHEEDQRQVLTINAYRMLEEGKMEQNVLLQEGDIIYVPPTVMGWIGLKLQEVLYPLQPVAQTYASPAGFMATTDDYRDNNNN